MDHARISPGVSVDQFSFAEIAFQKLWSISKSLSGHANMAL